MTGATQIFSEVTIAGGGLIGLSLGIALARAGIKTVVVDSQNPAHARSAKFDGRVCSIALGSQRIFKGINLWDDMAANAEPIREIRVSDQDSTQFLHYDHIDIGTEPLGWILENRHTRIALIDAAQECPNLTYLAPCSALSFEILESQTCIRLNNGSSVKSKLAIAADGKNSRLREEAEIRVKEKSYGQIGIVCTVNHSNPHRGIAHERFLAGGPFAILPMPNDQSSIVWTEKTEIAKQILEVNEHEFLTQLESRFGKFLGSLRVTGQRWSYPISLTHALKYTSQRLALVGDAAHSIHPLAGQGFNLGIRDVAVLAELIVDHYRLGMDIGNPALLEEYEKRRQFDVLSLIAVTDGLNSLFSNNIEALRIVRDMGLATVNRIPPLKRMFMKHAMGCTGELPRLARGLSL